MQNYSNSLWLHVAKIYRVIGVLAETVVWPILFLINMFTALKGSQFYFYIQSFKLQALCCDCTGQFVSDLVGNPNCWFSHAQVQIYSSFVVISSRKMLFFFLLGYLYGLTGSYSYSFIFSGKTHYENMSIKYTEIFQAAIK